MQSREETWGLQEVGQVVTQQQDCPGCDLGQTGLPDNREQIPGDLKDPPALSSMACGVHYVQHFVFL